MNFGIEIFIHIFGEQQSGTNIMIYMGSNKMLLYRVAKNLSSHYAKKYIKMNTQPLLQATLTECV